MPAVTTMKATGPASLGLIPQPTSAAENGLFSVSAPKADADRVARVTPIWTVARKRLGSARSLPSAAPRRPCSDRVRTWDSRREISASSVPEKKPPIRTNTMTMTMLSQTSLTGGALLGVFGWGSRPPWCLVGASGPSLSADPPLRQARQLAQRDLSAGTFRNRPD